MDTLPYLQIPFVHRGNTFSGADCFGLLQLFYKHELAVLLPDCSIEYEEEWWRTENLILDLCTEYNFTLVDTPQFGDAILFYNTSKVPGHIGIVIDEHQFIHMTKSGVGVANFLYGYWARQVHSIYRVTSDNKTR